MCCSDRAGVRDILGSPQTQARGLSRRGIIAGAGIVTAFGAGAQPGSDTIGTPPSVITNPPRQWGRGAPPDIYPDPDIIVVDPAFNQYLLGITAVRRVWTGFKWAEGPAWSSEGQYMVFSDVQANIQYRYIWETGQVTRFRDPSCNSNGNAFDFQGRQLSTQDFNRRVIRPHAIGVAFDPVDRHVGEAAHASQSGALHVESEHVAITARTGVAQPFSGADDIERLVVGRKADAVRIGKLILGNHDVQTSGRVPAIHAVGQLALLAANHAGIGSADTRVEHAVRVGRAAGIVGMAL
jgi:hypothetical protein